MNNPLNAAYDDTNKAIRTSSSGGSSSITSVTPGTGATNLGKAEDSAHSSGDVGVFDLGLANEAQTVLAQDGDYIGKSTDTKGNNLVVGNVAAGTTDAGSPVKVGGVNNTTLPTLTNGQRGDAQLGTRGAQLTTLMVSNSVTPISVAVSNVDGVTAGSVGSRFETTALTYGFNGTSFDRLRTSTVGTGVLQVSPENSYAHITTNATTVVKGSAGILRSIVINTKGVTNTATVYDNTAGSGTVIAVIDTTLSTTSFTYDIKFGTGLTIVTAGGTPPDITVSYR